VPALLAPAPEATARAALREQIARLERELAAAIAASYPRVAVSRPVAHAGPRLLTLAELERTRDALAAAVLEALRLAERQRARQAAARARLDAMYADPKAHRGETITNAELGLPGCTRYTVVGSLLGRWWRVKVSSGCP
jgi:hypothetical protein